METVSHLWNLTNALVKTESAVANNLRNHYIQCCRDLSDKVELPKNIFGAGTMCSHCGSLWRAVDSSVRISKSKNHSRGIRKLIRRRVDDDSSLSNFKRKLLDKCVKNCNNELVITCSVCHENTRVSLAKPKREQLKIERAGADEVQRTFLKKKKKKRDRSAGLIISTPTSSTTRTGPVGSESTTPTSQTSNLRSSKKKVQPQGMTPVQQSKKINIAKLKGMINATITPTKKTSLHSFLTELG